MPWEANALARLYRSDIDSWTLSASTLRALLERASSTIRYLELIRVDATADDDDDLGDIVNFSHLRRLCFDTTPGEFSSFLKRIKLPPSAQLSLRLYMESYDVEDMLLERTTNRA